MSWELPDALWFFASSSSWPLLLSLSALRRDSLLIAAMIRWKLHSALLSAILFSMIYDCTSTRAVSLTNTRSRRYSICKMCTGFMQPSWSWSHSWNITKNGKLVRNYIQNLSLYLRLIFLSWVTRERRLHPRRKSTISISLPCWIPSVFRTTSKGLNLSKRALTRCTVGGLSENWASKHSFKSLNGMVAIEYQQAC